MNGKKNRRTFITTGITAGMMAVNPVFSQSRRTYKAAIIGRTGGGDYGHGLDTIFNGYNRIKVVAVADENPTGLQQAKERIGVEKAYRDYHEMLEKERPDMVSIAPRQPDGHHDMALAAIDIGAHIYMEKPITEFPREADEILHAAKQKEIMISVAHTKRYSNPFWKIKELIHAGYFGDILEVRFTGKQDHRVGGEDLIVLGSHDMDMMRFFFGDPLWCFAHVAQDGQDITPHNIHQGQEPYTIAGDTLRADYQFSRNVQCRWTSIKANPEWNRAWKHHGRTINKWGFILFGTKRVLSYMEGIGINMMEFPFIPSMDADLPWKPLESLGKADQPAHDSHPVRNLIHSIETRTQPLCSGADALWAVEMVNAVYHAQIAKTRIPFPLQDRSHPLLEWQSRAG